MPITKIDQDMAPTLVSDISTKAPIHSPAFTGTPTGITKAHVGLGSADNTTDANKPISTSMQTALDLKQESDQYAAASLLTRIKTVDGDGSGLDADLLQGNDALRYLPYISGTTGVQDWNDSTNLREGIGPIMLQGNTSNGPTSSTELYYPCTIVYGGVQLTQMAIPVSAGDVSWYRSRYTGTWTAWSRTMGSRPMFSVTGVGPGPVDVVTNLVLSSIRTNIKSGYNASTGRFTCPQSGVYEILYRGLSLYSRSAQIQLLKNGALQALSYNPATTYSMDSLSWMGPCIAGDYFQVSIPAGSGVYAGSGYCEFQGKLVG